MRQPSSQTVNKTPAAISRFHDFASWRCIGISVPALVGLAGAVPEPMHVSAYDYGAVIGYNTARTPGLGSAIFLHINIGMATAGCVTLPAGELLEILHWLNPAASPQITMGVG
jgi:hypothetical protein